MWLLLASLPLLVIVTLLHTGRLVPKSVATPRESTPAAIERLEHELDVGLHNPATCRLCPVPIRNPYRAEYATGLDVLDLNEVYSWGNPKPIRSIPRTVRMEDVSALAAVFATEVFHGSGITDHTPLD